MVGRRREDEEGGEATERDVKIDGDKPPVPDSFNDTIALAIPDAPSEPERRPDVIVLSPNIQEALDLVGDKPRVLTDDDGNSSYFAQATSDGNTRTDGSGNVRDKGVDPLENRIDLSKPIKDSYNEFISGEKEFSRKDFVDYIQSIASETYKEQGVVDFVKDVANTLIFGYLKKEASLMYRDSQKLQTSLTLLGSIRDTKSLIQNVSALVGPEMDTIKGVMRQETILQTENLLETNKKYYETEREAIKSEQDKLDKEMKIYKASNDPKQLALIKPAVDRMTELTIRELKLSISFQDSGKHLDQIRLLKNTNFKIIENSIAQQSDSIDESDLNDNLSITLKNIYGSDSSVYKSYESQNQKMNQYIEAQKQVRIYEIMGDLASLYPKSPAVDIMVSLTKIGVINDYRRDLKNDFSKFSTSSTNRANEFHKALRKKILNRKID